MFAKSRKSLSLAVIVVVLGSILAACGPKKTSIDVSLVSYTITMSQESAPAGEVTFHVSNDTTDGMVHEFIIVKTDLAKDALPLDADGNVDEEAVNIVGAAEDMDAGTSQDLIVTLEPGHYVIMCNKPGHYALGMNLDFTVN